MFGAEVGLCKLARHALDVACGREYANDRGLCTYLVRQGWYLGRGQVGQPGEERGRTPEHEISGLPALESILENSSARSLVVTIREKPPLGPGIESARIFHFFGRMNTSLN